MKTNSTPIELKRIGYAGLVLLLLSLYLWIQQAFYAHVTVNNALSFHTALETATLVIFVSVFIVCWNAFGEVRKRSSLILALAFLSASIFGFLHALSFQGMPGFPDALDMHKSLSFWLLSRSIIGFTLLGLILLSDDIDVSNTKSRLAAMAVLIASAIVATGIFRFPNRF